MNSEAEEALEHVGIDVRRHFRLLCISSLATFTTLIVLQLKFPNYGLLLAPLGLLPSIVVISHYKYIYNKGSRTKLSWFSIIKACVRPDKYL